MIYPILQIEMHVNRTKNEGESYAQEAQEHVLSNTNMQSMFSSHAFSSGIQTRKLLMEKVSSGKLLRLRRHTRSRAVTHYICTVKYG